MAKLTPAAKSGHEPANIFSRVISERCFSREYWDLAKICENEPVFEFFLKNKYHIWVSGSYNFSRWMSSDELWITPNRFKLNSRWMRLKPPQGRHALLFWKKEKEIHLIFMALNPTKHLESSLIIENFFSEYSIHLLFCSWIAQST